MAKGQGGDWRTDKMTKGRVDTGANDKGQGGHWGK